MSPLPTASRVVTLCPLPRALSGQGTWPGHWLTAQDLVCKMTLESVHLQVLRGVHSCVLVFSVWYAVVNNDRFGIC